MKTNKLLKWLAGLALIATSAGVLSGCYVETRRRYHGYYHRPVSWCAALTSRVCSFGASSWVAVLRDGWVSGFQPTEMFGDASDDASIDAPEGSGSSSVACFDADGIALHVCLASPPSGANKPGSMVIDTTHVGGACEPLAPASDPAA